MKRALLVLSFIAGCSVPAAAQQSAADFYKGKTIRIVVGIDVGSGYDVTARVLQEAGKLAQSYGELQGVLTEMKNVARNSAVLNLRFATNESRIIELERGVQKLSTVPPPLTNDVPAFSSDTNDAPKP